MGLLLCSAVCIEHFPDYAGEVGRALSFILCAKDFPLITLSRCGYAPPILLAFKTFEISERSV